MEFSGSSTAFAVGQHEAPELARLFDRPGPFVTVYLTTDPQIDNAGHRSLQRWGPLRGELEAAGAPRAAVDGIEALVPDAHLEGSCLGAVADESGVLFVRAAGDPPARDVARVAALPVVGPLVTWRQSDVPYVLVVADRTGADITAVGPEGRPNVEAVSEEDYPLRKVNAGGWSQRRYQERAENTWEANAKAVAERTASVADYIGARVVLVAGDVRALQFLQEHLPERVAANVQALEGGRGVDGGTDSMLEAARKQVATVAAEDTVAILAKFREERGQRDRAADGPAATIETLNAASVEVLLVHDEMNDGRLAWFAPDGALVALEASELQNYGVDRPQQGRLVDALIRTAFRTGARVRTVPSTIANEGVGAILRFRS